MSPTSDKINEACGVFGISIAKGDSRDAAASVYNALFALQHRGQESAGIAIRMPQGLRLHKGPGLVPDVISARDLERLKGASAAIGHVRYASDSADAAPMNTQPILVRHASGTMALCYNGKLVNSKALRLETETRGGIFQTSNDAELISYIIVREHLRTNTTEDAILNAMHYMIGAYSLVVLDDHKLIAARDPNGFRPLCVGQVGDSYMFASESCAFEALGGHLIREVEPGEIVVAENGELKSYLCGIHARSSLCMFEFIYFARPDSILDGVAVDLARRESGRCLARRSTTDADIVIGVPDSGMASAMGFAAESGIPYAVGLMKNRYIGRTFIQPTKDERERSVRIKLNAIKAVVADRRVILVDDSIVRGTTSERLVKLLREAGAREVHMKISSPPFLNPCYFGTAIPDREELAAYNRTESDICAMIGADSLQYLPCEDFHVMMKDLKHGFCDACFTGNYAVPVPAT
ncbi:MAG: Amidophosphoribosyltransferase [Oscillospiraceae bacterium]|nr:Amidophosphoribosyltransferase [Oscillospiraceae bacterium]